MYARGVIYVHVIMEYNLKVYKEHFIKSFCIEYIFNIPSASFFFMDDDYIQCVFEYIMLTNLSENDRWKLFFICMWYNSFGNFICILNVWMKKQMKVLNEVDQIYYCMNSFIFYYVSIIVCIIIMDNI